jgi:hypothetical protein
MAFKKATNRRPFLRMLLGGPSGSGKTFTAMKLMASLTDRVGKEFGVIDTEHQSSSLYSGLFPHQASYLDDFENDKSVGKKSSDLIYHPTNYVREIRDAKDAGFGGLVIDSLSHAWFAEREIVGGNFNKWKEVRPFERELISSMMSPVSSPFHIIATVRSKSEYVDDVDYRGKTVKKKVGTAPIQAAGIEFEFDIFGEMSIDNVLSFNEKCRCPELKGRSFMEPGDEVANIIADWIQGGNLGAYQEVYVESAESKAQRVKTIMSELSIGFDVVVPLLEKNYSVQTPADLSTEQVDELIELLGKKAA